jgi:methylaspartate mutase epsilon subunit
MAFDIKNEQLSNEEFFKKRKEILNQWETGRQVANLFENIAAAKELSLGKSYALTLAEHKHKGLNLLEPQFGQALTEYMIEGIGYVEANSDLHPHGAWTIFSDTYTRKGDFAKAAAGMERSKKEAKTMLNGWPIVCCGVEDARKILRASKCPLNLNSADEDAGLQTEIAFAAGWNGGNNNPIMTCVAHSKDIPMDKLLKIKQYDARLGGIYTENGVPICPHNTSNLTGYDTPGMKVFTNVVQALFGAAQGIKYQHVMHGLGMNILQDAAMVRVSEKLCNEYCERFGYKDMTFITGGYPFLGAWPPRVEEAHAMIAWNAVVDIMGGFTNVVLKCEDEAFATPTKEGMANSVRLARHLITLLGTQKLPESEEIKLEAKMIEIEVRAILEKSLEAGDGDILTGLCMAVECGWFDTMVSPWKHVKGKVRYIRDAANAVRYFDTGNVPIPKEAKEYNDAKLREREEKQKIKLTFDTVVNDLQFASRLPVPVSMKHYKRHGLH